MSAALTDLLVASERICGEERLARVVVRHCTFTQGDGVQRRLHMRIHRNDQMLLHSLMHHQDAEVALSQYYSVSLQQHYAAIQIFRAFFDQQDTTVEVLDFACGYGRLLRLLKLSLPTSQLWASEIQPDAVEFVQQAFGVQAVPSHVDPERFEPGRKFDFIWVASLFSHLPHSLFQAWVKKLASLLTERGVLCFSTRSSDLLPSGHILPESGILYFRDSEVTDLDADVYGTAYVSESYVSRSIESALGEGHPYRRLVKALAHEQDVYVVCRDRTRGMESLASFRRGPWGWLDQRRYAPDGVLELQGWAASLDEGRVDSVEVRVDGILQQGMSTVRREDVRDAFADERLIDSGWALRVPTHNQLSPELEISARTTRGELALIFSGHVSSDV